MLLTQRLQDLWLGLPAERRHHLVPALLGTACSWVLAALMACTTTEPPPPLYLQLGGIARIDDITSRTLDRMAADPDAGQSFRGVRLSYLKRSVSAYLCKVADGPCVYEGETMRNSHAQSAIRAHEFDRMVSVLREELDRANVRDSAKNELLRRLAPTRRDIVQP